MVPFTPRCVRKHGVGAKEVSAKEITAECFRRDMLAATCFAANLLQLSSCLAVSEISTVGIALEDAVIACLKARSALNQIAEQTTKWQLGFESTDIEGGMCCSCRLDHEGLMEVASQLDQISENLRASLPAVGAAAAYSTKDWRLKFRRSAFDPVISIYALLDRADGSSSDGPNQNISIADIERLERLEADTQDAIDCAAAALGISRQVVAFDLPAMDSKSMNDNLGCLATQSRRAATKIGCILAEVPKQELAQIKKSAGLGGLNV
eukprot:CAMPEP_0114236888 /NCGR_PEP_ID=MMETSP0058-20121206/7090_1 /TAXON_ID=36894 /ORGANISM="Pyramimonas parkeae, CCMP726" /LENGTH=265 /DNA_ID=CAMNT_0001348879 /DNA_START=121 /DNA_END=918 /DNA_ORIENTATION=+